MVSTESSIMDKMRKAIIDYGMIDNDTPIMVGLSGGKDSFALLYMLAQFLRRSKHKYRLAAGHIDLGYGDDLQRMQQFCDEINVPLFIEKTNISEVVFDIRKEKNPCSLCAKMRRGALNSLAKQNGYDKVALGHHLDDVTETLLLNICFEGRVDSFKPVTWLSNQQVTVIRPFIYVPEKDIIKFAESLQLPVINSCCPANTATKRQDMKAVVEQLETISPGCKQRVVRALRDLQGNDWHDLYTKNRE